MSNPVISQPATLQPTHRPEEVAQSTVHTTDVVIVGAGISGIGAAAHLGMQCPNQRYVVLEAREHVGGTWDLFRYPGIRSDSDMHTLGFSFNPWNHQDAIADGSKIRNYIAETAEQFGVTPNLRLGHKVISAHWSSEQARWRIIAQRRDGTQVIFDARFLFMGSGYYSYEQAHEPHFAGREDFQGQIVHPQFWPESLDVSGKRVVVIGSGATAVTLIPSLAQHAEHVIMLQRSPTYIVARPARDRLANVLKKILPGNVGAHVTRWKNVLLGRYFVNRSRKRPQRVMEFLLKLAKAELPEGYNMAHFTPRYNPWEQRVCLAPDGDFFQSIRENKASIVTDHIDRFTATGIRLKSGQELRADIIVTATGLKLLTGGHVDMAIDGRALRFGDVFSYKGVMFSNVPNFSLVFGYTAASWTLKADLAAIYCCRLIKFMDEHGYDVALPYLAEPEAMEKRPMLSFSAGYVQRSIAELPKQGPSHPWVINQDYLLDRKILLRDPLEDGVLQFARHARPAPTRGDNPAYPMTA
jgi:cation diffusion facilitator CzcD-associated flavoprotein CzcO